MLWSRKTGLWQAVTSLLRPHPKFAHLCSKFAQTLSKEEGLLNKALIVESCSLNGTLRSFGINTKPPMELFSFHLSYIDISIIVAVALLTGMAKTGVHGAGMITVPMLAAGFGGKLSSGVMLPLLVMADMMGVWYYHRHASWSHLKILFPWAAVGVVLGTVFGQYINDYGFKLVMAGIVLISVGIMIWMERDRTAEIPSNKWFGLVTGVLGGFTSMIGNLAGPVMSLYLLSMRLPKNAFIGTAAWFFLVINWFKVPFHLFMWKTITPSAVKLDLLMLPVVLVGGFLGVMITKQLSEKSYRWFIIVMTVAAAVFMFL